MVTSRSLRFFLLLSGLLLILGGLVMRTGSATLVVDDDGTAPFTSIQPAVDAAIPGTDDVLVRCGRYVENVVMRDGVSIRGVDAGCVTLVRADPLEAAVTLPSVGSTTVLSQFTIKNGPSPWSGTYAILITGGAPVITRNVIEGEGQATNSGRGIVAQGGSPVISYNVVRGNHDCCYGGGVVLQDSDATVRSNLIVDNGSYYGAGLLVGTYSEPTVHHNTIVGNQAWLGGGILTYGGGILADNVIAGNSAVLYGGAVVEWGAGGTSFLHNDFFGNDPEDFLGPVGQNGNISADPQFLAPGDRSVAGFQPRSSSPLIDAASESSTVVRDLRGIPRPLDGNVDAVAVSDIGARENEGVTGLVPTAARWSWDPGLHQPMVYNVYRGDLTFLRQTGIYTQDPGAVAGARHFCDVPASLDDADTPEPGQVFFYLPVAHGAVEGSLGFDSRLVERPKTLFCTEP